MAVDSWRISKHYPLDYTINGQGTPNYTYYPLIPGSQNPLQAFKQQDSQHYFDKEREMHEE